MVKLFRYEDYTVTIEPEALLLEPFRILWDRDKSQDKRRAKQDLGYVYFMGDPRSDYQYLIDEKARSAEIIKGEGLPEKWKPDRDVKRALEFYQSFKPISAALLEDTRVAVDKLRKLLRDIDLNAVDEKGKPIHTLTSITSTIKQIPALAKDLESAEKALTKDIISEDKARGSQTKSLYEDV